MAKNILYTSLFSALAAATVLIGCLQPEQGAAPSHIIRDTTKVLNPLDTPKVIPKPDSPKVVRPDSPLVVKPVNPGGDTITTPIKNGGWDDFPNKYLPDLKQLAAGANRLPTPLGTRYNAPTTVKPQTKISADTTCPDGPREIFGYSNAGPGNPSGSLYVVDTIRYYNKAGAVSCRWHTLETARETHNRHIMDLNAGESWEYIVDSVSQQDVMPRHSITGTGFIKLHSGIEFTLESYKVQYTSSYFEPGVVITGGHLRLGWKGKYRMNLDIVKAMPFKDDDFFPVRGQPGFGDRVMSGPIKEDTTTVGYVDLFADHSVVIRDWTGKRVDP